MHTQANRKTDKQTDIKYRHQPEIKYIPRWVISTGLPQNTELWQIKRPGILRDNYVSINVTTIVRHNFRS